MTTLTRKYKTRLEIAMNRRSMRRGCESIKNKIIEFNDLYPETMDKFSKMYRYLGVIGANGSIKFIEELAEQKLALIRR